MEGEYQSDGAQPEVVVELPTREVLQERLSQTERQRNDALAVAEERGQRLADLIERFDAFKSDVRRIGIEEHIADRWCRDGLNRRLEELGLEPYAPRYTGWLEVSVRFVVDGAENEDQAVNWVRDALKLDSGDTDVEFMDDDEDRQISVRHIEQDDEY